MAQDVVLVVDDDPDIRESLEDLLRLDGFEATTAASGAEALEILGDVPVGLVLLDLMMPIMSGRQVVEEMRRRGIQVPVILLSAGRELLRAAEELSLPALCKPFDLEELLSAVRKGLLGETPALKAPISG